MSTEKSPDQRPKRPIYVDAFITVVVVLVIAIVATALAAF